MSSSVASVTRSRRTIAVGTVLFVAAVIVLVVAQMVGRAATVPSQLHYSRGFLVTGNYVVGGVDLTETANPIVNGFSTGTIQMGNAVPPKADIVAAYLYWETITLTSTPSQGAGVKFRGVNIDITNDLTVKETSQPLIGETAPCWSTGVPLTMHHYRADVLRLLPMLVDATNQPTGKRIVNDADLIAHSLPAHTVTLPVSPDNNIPESAGASLVVIYREDPNPGAAPTEPLRKIVIYDGLHIQTSINEATTLNIQGFYKAASPASAKITHIIGSGQPNSRERILFNGNTLESDPFKIGSASQRAWSQDATSTTNATYDVSAYMGAATNSAQYGQTVTTTIDHSPTTGGFDCITSGAVIFSTAVQDNDDDGLPDGLEDATSAMTDPDGTPLPNLHAMGADSNQADAFVEVNAMRADAGTEYGSALAPYDLAKSITTKTDDNGHHHLPTPADIKMIGDRLDLHGIRLHVDVGPLVESSGLCENPITGSGALPICYHSRPNVIHTDWVDNYSSTDADEYLVGSGIPSSNGATLARGGEIITERACDAAEPTCQFPDFPGTVGWKVDFKFHRDWPVDNEGQEFSIDPMASDYFNWNTGSHRIRFDAGRRGVFHYVLYAHARGKPKSMPCLINGLPGPYDKNNGTACTTANPDFNSLEYHVPSSASGIADLPGYNVMVALGLWDEFVGRPFVRASTTFHELGHNWELWHGGISADWGNKALGSTTYIEPHCKPYYLSSMSYLFQVHGLFDVNDVINLDFSGTAYAGSAETGTLQDSVQGDLSPSPLYEPAWFAPSSSQLASTLGVSAATKYCSGQKFTGTPFMARVHTSSPSANIDWKGDGYAPPASLNNSVNNQDVNFDGTVTGGLRVLGGFDDWVNIRLNQVGMNVTGIVRGSIEGTAEWAGGTGEWAGGSGEWGGGTSEWAGGTSEWAGGTVEYAGGTSEWGGGTSEWGGGTSEWAGGTSEWAGGRGEREISFNLAKEMGKSRPYALTVCRIGQDSNCVTQAQPSTALYHRVEVGFQAPPFGGFTSYEVQRKRASAPDSAFTLAGTTSTNLFIDQTELPDGIFNTVQQTALQYVYRVRGVASDGNSEWSRTSAAVTPVNEPPQAANDPATGTFTVSNRGSRQFVVQTDLLANDTDVDSPTTFRARRLLSFTQPVNGGTVTANSDKTILTYTPPSRSYTGPDSFTYIADDGLSSDTPQVPLSGPSPTAATVSITVTR